MTDISQPPRGALERCLPAVFITKPSPPANTNTHTHKQSAHGYRHTHLHTLTPPTVPPLFYPYSSLLKSFSHTSIQFDSKSPHWPWLPLVPLCCLRPLFLLLSPTPFHALHPTGLKPPNTPHEAQCCWRAAVMNAPGHATNAPLPHHIFTVDPRRRAC